MTQAGRKCGVSFGVSQWVVVLMFGVKLDIVLRKA